MVIWLVLLGFVGLGVVALFVDFSGRLAAKLQLAGGLLAGFCFALAAALLALQEPWTPALILDKSQPLHGGSAVFALILQVAIYAGPQLTALALAGFAYYILRGAWTMWLVRSR